jgi:alpha-glucosidase
MADRLWWKDGVIYQIYPRSFQDANGDGVGDLEGIRQRLDHLVWLGVDAIWLSPCFPSPMADFGYDVADYCAIDPLFGSLADFDRLLADAHARNIRIVLDWVPNHTSVAHAWFAESRASRTNAKRDWYVWRDARPDGSLPNNWVSIFGGPAWELDPATGQYYLHSFLVEQPDLNWRNPEVVEAMHGVLRFWLDRGVDGFRIDVIHRIAKHPALLDNPLVEGATGYGGQLHHHDENHPDVHELLRGLRRVHDAYDERMMVGEVYLFDPDEVGKYYGDGDELHLSFNFSFLRSPWDAAAFRREIERFERAVPASGWPDVVLGNHDVPRAASRYDHPTLGDARARVAAMMLLTLRGTPFLYYGEEIGMRNVAVPKERLQDPLAWTLHPGLSRDPERTPMCWDRSANAGFTSSAQPWLPLGPQPPHTDVATQRDDRASLLWLHKDLLALRREHPSLHRGSYRSLDAPDGVLAYERRCGDEVARVALNFGDERRDVSLGAGRVAHQLHTNPAAKIIDPSAFSLGRAEGVVVIVS